MTRRARGGARSVAAALLFAAAGLACREGDGQRARLPLPESESIALAAETRPGVWLSPGDAVEWSLPPGPAARVSGGYASHLAGRAAGKLRLEVSSAGRPRRSEIPLSSDPGGWRAWSGRIPARDESSTLRITWSNDGPGAAARSLFVNEPFLSTSRRAGRTIVLLLVDTLRADHVSGYGYRLPTTPVLDRYFDGWLRAETCLTAANWTLPSHASLFTSAPVSRHGVGRYGHRLGDDLPTLAGTLADAGYRTLAVTGGGYVDASFGLARGFDRYAVVPGAADKAVAAALAMVGQERDGPVFLFLHTYQVHDFAPDEDAARRLFPDEVVLGPRWREDVAGLRVESAMTDPRFPVWIRARYDAALASVDEAFGKLLEGLGRQGREEPAVLFTSDHGEGLCDRTFRGQCLEWGHGSPYLFEEELRVPLEARIPWRPEAKGVVAGNATLLDVAPTLVSAAGAPVPASFEGRSLLSRAAPPDRAVVTEAPPLDALALRKAATKLVRRTGGAQRSLFDDSVFYYSLPAEECYDLARDPQERRRLPCAPTLAEEADRYVTSSFPDALVVRVPPREIGGGGCLRRSGRAGDPRRRPCGRSAWPRRRSSRGAARSRRPGSSSASPRSGSPSSRRAARARSSCSRADSPWCLTAGSVFGPARTAGPTSPGTRPRPSSARRSCLRRPRRRARRPPEPPSRARSARDFSPWDTCAGRRRSRPLSSRRRRPREKARRLSLRAK